MTGKDRYDDETLAAMLRELAEPPRHWVEAAKQLPEARRQIGSIVERAERDKDYRAQVLAGLESALRDAGHEPTPHLVAALRSRLTETGDV